MALVKEGGEKSTARANQMSAPNDRKAKTKISNGSGVVPAATVQPSLSIQDTSSIADADILPSEEQNLISVHEFQIDDISKEELNKVILDSIPNYLKNDESKETNDIIPEPFIEQNLFPLDGRKELIKDVRFSLIPTNFVSDFEEENVPFPEAKADISAKETSRKRVVGKTEENEDDIEKDMPHRFRWLILPNETKEIGVKFSSLDTGRFEQDLNFEIMGTRTVYTIKCTGLCQYAHFSTDYKKIFPKVRKARDEKQIIHGEYIINQGMYDFGPLLSAKQREKYLEKFPENRVIINFSNPSLTSDLKIYFAMKNDLKGETFFFDPPSMEIQPGQMQHLSLWAYPKSPIYYEDTLVCCIKDNPEPQVFKVTCLGVKPEIDVDKKVLTFEKMLLGRMEQREVNLKNNSYLPVTWRLMQLESLGEEFEVTPLEGLLEPFQEAKICAEFRAAKPLVVKRLIKLEVFDLEKIGGVVMEVPILVTAEAYDIAMDLHFPKGYDGLDFGTLKVFEEGKQLCALKNKGKYEVGYRFINESKEMASLISISPQVGTIQPSDKPTQIQLVFKAQKEVSIKDASGLKCQFYEPATNEIITSTTVKVSARAVFSKYSILPLRDLNFGSLVHGAKGVRQISIENTGEFDFRFSLYKIMERAITTNASTVDHKVGKSKSLVKQIAKGNRPSSPPLAKLVNRKEIVKQNDSANFGAFTVFPTSGLCTAGQKTNINVELHSELPGIFEEHIAIDITDRPPSDQDIIEYIISGESCIPGINTTDFHSIFEEQTVSKRLELFNIQTCVYAEEDRVFYFGAYLAGQMAQVRFKISNPSKVPCDVTISTRPRSKNKSEVSDFAFEVEPKKLNIQSHEYRYVTVSFHPTSLQSYAGIFEAIVENVIESKSKCLSFELRGEGTLPRVSIESPSALKGKNGIATMNFKKILVGACHTLPLIIKNEGIITSRMKLEWVSRDGDEFICEGVNTIHTLKPFETKSLDVGCNSKSTKKMDGELKLRVLDNAFEDSTIILCAEGYIDDITFANTSGENGNEIIFENCYINRSHSITFGIANHSKDILRIILPESPEFKFSASIVHIRPRNTKDLTVSFIAFHPCEIKQTPLIFKISKIKLHSNQVPAFDWDNAVNAKVSKQLAEPAFEAIYNSNVERTLLFSAFADYCEYEAEIKTINFKSTFMYQTRSYRIPLKNSGKVDMKFDFLFFNDVGQQVEAGTEDCAFVIEPSSGLIAPGEFSMLNVKFSPIEEGEYNDFVMVGVIPNLSRSQKPFNIKLSGTSVKPFCHFELESSDYIANERSNPDIMTNNGTPASLDLETKVIEISTCGIKVRNTRRFYIVNPTDEAWQFEWHYDCGADQRVFRCITPKGTVIPHKKYEIAFEFTPESIDTKVN